MHLHSFLFHITAYTQTLEIAEMQLRDQNDKRIEVSTIPEAYFFSNKGFDDILYGVIPSESKFRQIEQISTLQSPNILSVMSASKYLTQSMINYAKYNATTDNFKFNVFIKVDSGTKRAGFDICANRTEEQRLELLDTINLINANQDCINFMGLYQYSSQGYSLDGVDKIREIFESERQILMRQIAEIESECNIQIPIVSSGSTPSCMAVDNFEGITEIHPGNYVFFDRMQYEFGVVDDLDQISISVITRIIGRYPHRNEILIDCGSVGLSLDKNSNNIMGMRQEQAIDVGYGGIRGFPNLKVHALSQEVGKITTVDGSYIDFDDEALQYGKVLRLIPHHSCLAACQHPYYYIVDDNDMVIDVYNKVGGW